MKEGKMEGQMNHTDCSYLKSVPINLIGFIAT